MPNQQILNEGQQQVSAIAKFGIPAAVVLVLLGVVAGFVYFVKTSSNKNFAPETKTINCTFDIETKVVKCTDQDKQVVNPKELFTPGNMRRYEAGSGFELSITQVRNGKSDSSQGAAGSAEKPTFEVSTFTRYQEQLPGERDPYLKVKRREFAEWWSRVVNSEPIERAEIVYVDDTDGIDQQFSDYAKAKIRKKVQRMLATGDGVTVFLHRGGNNISENRKSVVLPMKFGECVDKEALWKQFEQDLAWVFQPRPAQKNSALYFGLFAALSDTDHAEFQVRDIDLFTDGKENTSQLSLYQRRDLSLKANWKQLDAEIEKIAAFPDFPGAAVYLHAPPAEGEDGKLSLNLQEYLKDRFRTKSKAAFVQAKIGFND